MASMRCKHGDEVTGLLLVAMAVCFSICVRVRWPKDMPNAHRRSRRIPLGGTDPSKFSVPPVQRLGGVLMSIPLTVRPHSASGVREEGVRGGVQSGGVVGSGGRRRGRIQRCNTGGGLDIPASVDGLVACSSGPGSKTAGLCPAARAMCSLLHSATQSQKCPDISKSETRSRSA